MWGFRLNSGDRVEGEKRLLDCLTFSTDIEGLTRTNARASNQYLILGQVSL